MMTKTSPVRETLADDLRELLGPASIGVTSPVRFTPELKARLLTIADDLGPDYAQALYHAAVFMTRVV